MGNRKNNNQLPGQITLFDLEMLPTECRSIDDELEAIRHKDLRGYRTLTIKSGNMLECEIFPIWQTAEKKRAKSISPSSQAQMNLNHKNAKKKIIRLTNANFTNGDIWATFGYDDANKPGTLEKAQNDIANYFRRLARKRKKSGLPNLKYIYVIEFQSENGKVRCHHHVIMSGGLDRDEIEKSWKGGAYPQTRRLRAKEDCGLTGLASYLAKGKTHEKKWNYSKGLKKPSVTIANHKFKKSHIEKMIADESRIPELLESKCKGYAFRDIEIKRSDFVAGVYVYANMFRRC
ncbi:MAG: hypothetical protein FWG91_13820 [Lachnospiraceae bacterium]|nr:hypothetical protein [Lachnospiraceae bacterium]